MMVRVPILDVLVLVSQDMHCGLYNCSSLWKFKYIFSIVFVWFNMLIIMTMLFSSPSYFILEQKKKKKIICLIWYCSIEFSSLFISFIRSNALSGPCQMLWRIRTCWWCAMVVQLMPSWDSWFSTTLLPLSCYRYANITRFRFLWRNGCMHYWLFS